MAKKPERSVSHLLSDARRALNMVQREFGSALGASHRTATRWDAGKSVPAEHHLRTLTELLYPVDRALAAEAAAHVGETLESLGLEAPPAPPAPPIAPPKARPADGDLADIVVCAAAEATDVSPRAVRSVLYVAFRRACQLGLTVEAMERALAPPDTANAPST
jgi:transcriptional regulator with XRE-family HTH domain